MLYLSGIYADVKFFPPKIPTVNSFANLKFWKFNILNVHKTITHNCLPFMKGMEWEHG